MPTKIDRRADQRKLTPKQEAFAQHYSAGLVVKTAVLKAGYSRNRPDEIGYQLLQNPTVHAAIERYRRKSRQKLDISCLRVIQEYVSIGMSNIKNVVDQDPVTMKVTVKKLADLPDHVTASIASIECKEQKGKYGTEHSIKVSLWPKVPALESLCKALGFDKVSLEKELVAIENQNGPQEQTMLDPKTFTKEQWTVFKELNAKRLEELKP